MLGPYEPAPAATEPVSPRPPARGASPAARDYATAVPPRADPAGDMSHLVGVDVGGTFTDALLMPLDGSRTVLAKVPTAADPAQSVVAAVIEAVERADVDADSVELILNGTTIATNTVLEGAGARVGALVTRGFRYVLEIARSWTPGPISGWMVWDRPAALADVRDIAEISGRISARGELLEAIDEREVRATVEALVASGIEALTVSLFNGYARPDIEVHIRELAVRPSQVVPCERFQPPEWRLVVKGAVWSASIGEVEPAGEGEAPLLAVAVDGAVGPAAEQGADEALGFAVRARRVGAGAQVFDPERLAGERVHDQRRRRSRCRSSPARCGSRARGGGRARGAASRPRSSPSPPRPPRRRRAWSH